VVLAKRTRSAVHSRNCETAPALAATVADCTVWIESTTSSAACRGLIEDGLQVGLREYLEGGRGNTEPPGPQPNLGDRFFAARVEHGAAGGDVRRHLQQQSGFADAGVAADQSDRPWNDAASEHPVELCLTACQALEVIRRAERHGSGARAGDGSASTRAACRGGGPSHRALLEGVPLAAGRTLPLPFQGFTPAGATNEDGYRTRHRYASQTSLAGLSYDARPGEDRMTGL
jgi:hypothetical protein